MRKGIFIILLFLNGYLYAQREQLDSLQRILPTLNEDSVGVVTLINLSFSYLYISPDSTILYADKALAIAQKLGNRDLEAFALSRKGLGYWTKGDLFDALRNATLGLEIAEKIGNQDITARSLANIGLIYYDIGNYGMALRYHLMGYEYLKLFPKKYVTGINLCNIANDYVKLHEFDSARSTLAKIEPLLAEHKGDLHVFYNIVYGNLMMEQGNHVEAKKYYEKTIAVERSNPNTYIALARIALAEMYFAEGDLLTSERLAKEGLEMAKKFRFKSGMYRAYLAMSKLEEVRGDFQGALRYKDLSIAYKDSVESQTVINNVKIFDYQREQGEIGTLQKEKALEIAKSQKQHQLIIGIILLFMATLLGMGYSIYQKQKHNRALSLQAVAIMEMNTEITKSKEALRHKAEELEKTVEIISEQKKEIEEKNHELHATSEILKNKLDELNHAQVLLEQREKKLSVALSENKAITIALDNGLIVSLTDLRGMILKVNHVFCEVSGYPEHELIGKTHHIINSGLHPASFWKEMWKTIAEGRVWRNDVCNRTRSGKLYWVDTIITPVYDEHGQMIQFLSIRTLITDRKLAEEEQARLLSITQHQNTRLQNFAYIVSHNLRSHSSNINLLLSLLADEHAQLTAEPIFMHLTSAGANLMESLELLSQVTSLETKEKTLHPINIHEAVKKAMDSTVALSNKENVLITNMLTGSETVLGEKSYVDSVILNLLTNAIKYRSSERQSKVVFRCSELENHIVLHVEDNGQGIDLAKYGKRLFGMFKTFHKHPDARGVGLFITKNQVEYMGGEIEVESQVGVGSTFHVYFQKPHV